MSGHNTIEVTDQNFDSKVSKGNWILDFWAAWCGPCRMMSPIFDETASEAKDKYHFGSVNVDEQNDLAQRFEVMSIPTLIFLKDGEVVNRTVGVIEKEDILQVAEESF